MLAQWSRPGSGKAVVLREVSTEYVHAKDTDRQAATRPRMMMMMARKHACLARFRDCIPPSQRHHPLLQLCGAGHISSGTGRLKATVGSGALPLRLRQQGHTRLEIG